MYLIIPKLKNFPSRSFFHLHTIIRVLLLMICAMDMCPHTYIKVFKVFQEIRTKFNFNLK